MELLYSILGVVHIVVCVVLVFFILMQKSTGSGLFSSGSSGNPFMSGIEVTTFLSKVTKYLGVFFVLNTLFLGALSVKISNKNKVLSNPIEAVQVQDSNKVPVGSK